MPKLHVNGIDLFYSITGLETGDWLLLIPGFASDTTTWALMLPELAKKYRVLGLDNRDSGQSDSIEIPYSMTEMARDAAALLAQLEIQAVHVIGHSMGGQIAQELALLHPGQVKSLTLIATWAETDAKFRALLAFFGELPQKLAITDYLKSLVHWSLSNRFFARPQALEEIFNAIESNPHPPTAAGLWHQSQAIIHSNTGPRLSDITCPTLVLHGDQDLITPLYFGEELATGIPQAELVVLANTGHGCVIEAATEVNQALLKFLDNL